MKSQANIKGWVDNILAYGDKAGSVNGDDKGSVWEGWAWYYDGQKVFYQIADYLGDPDGKWTGYALKSMNVYRSYVLKNNGRVPGYRIFPHGLYMHYTQTGDPESKQAIELLSSSAAYAPQGGGLGVNLSRETAFILNARIKNFDLGHTNSNVHTPLEYALGHLGQWLKTDSYIQPFMVALTCEAVIDYLRLFPTAGVHTIICQVLDMLWDRCWIDYGFVYDTNASSPAPDLNLLIAPAYAWAYLKTGEAKWLERGDKIFNAGVEKAWLGGGKQFSQNYRWSFDYIKWVAEREVIDTPPAPPELTTDQKINEIYRIVKQFDKPQ